jgi:hypothetical protein
MFGEKALTLDAFFPSQRNSKLQKVMLTQGKKIKASLEEF